MAVAIMIVILVGSIILHEVAHGLTAYWFGDNTAKEAGRLTLNPISHIDPLGSVIIPALCLIFGWPIIGWANPVPINPYHLQPNMIGKFCVSIAGITTNLLIAFLGALAIRLVNWDWNTIWPQILFLIVHINVMLAVFNLFPIPPLDGSRIFITNWVSDRVAMQIEQYSLMFLFLLIVILPYLPIMKLIVIVVGFLTGIYPY